MLHQTKISIYRKLNLPLTNSIYFVFLPLEMQKRLKQIKVYHAFCYFTLKETTDKHLKVAAAKTLFSSLCVIGTTCFHECFLFYVITGRHYFSWKFRDIGKGGQFCGIGIFPIKKLLKFSAVTDVQAILGSTQWKCSGSVFKNSCFEIKKEPARWA